MNESVVVNFVIYLIMNHKKVMALSLEQVSVSTKRMLTSQVPNYPNLPSQLMCQVHNVTLHVCDLFINFCITKGLVCQLRLKILLAMSVFIFVLFDSQTQKQMKFILK